MAGESAVAAGTGGPGSIVAPLPVVIGTVVEPPAADFTVTVGGGATTPVNAVPVIGPKPVTVNAGLAPSLETAWTVSVCASASYRAWFTVTTSTSGCCLRLTGRSPALITSMVVPAGGVRVSGKRP